jgi:7-alpha-hydroxysteroid dehydrogenase
MGGFDLTGRVAVVVGAGSGIGGGISSALAAAGASVLLASEVSCAINDTAATITADGGTALAVHADLTDAFSLGSLATTAVETFGDLDIWVNNAEPDERIRSLADLSKSEWDAFVARNFTAVWAGSMAAADQMRWGAIVNVVSTGAYGPPAGRGHYAACKAAVVSLTKSLAVELAPDIRVNAVAPGMVPPAVQFDAVFDGELDSHELQTRASLGLGTPADVGAAVAYLSSPAARWVSGQTIRVVGGSTSV